MKKYIDKSSIVFAVGGLVGASVFAMFISPKLPASLGGGIA